MIDYLQILRPQQWLKNLFVFAPAFFSNNLLDVAYLLPSFLVFCSFCLISGSIYCINDICDADSDRDHPRKCMRPIASGRLSKSKASIISGVCALLSLGLVVCVSNTNVLWLLTIIIIYWMMNIAYCYRLKRYAIVDVFCIATGFVLRVVIGGIATGIMVSEWIVLLTFLIALFMGLSKRYDDYCIYERTGSVPRKSIRCYNSAFIKLSISIVASVTMVCYIMYTMSEVVIGRLGTSFLYLTAIWVIAGILRFLQNMVVYERSSSPTKQLINDHFIHICILGWLLSFFLIIYM